jgi:glycosyltransferase involved in cell wall biosynthesis
VASTNLQKVGFYYLSAFSETGGIEKFNRCFIKALSETENKATTIEVSVVSVYDKTPDPRYFSGSRFWGFDKKKIRSALFMMKHSLKNDIIILGHINLFIIGVFAKIANPRCKIYMVAHGIESWGKMYGLKNLFVNHLATILSVSTYTKNQLVLRNGVRPSRIKLFPNTLDPFFQIPSLFKKPENLVQRYSLGAHQLVILTLSRLLKSEQNKGYDTIIKGLPLLLEKFPNLVYILAGKYDHVEKVRIDSLIKSNGLQDHVILTGYIKDEEITDHYRLADVFIMPSRKEGFGIVFLEALACGTPVIGGNRDGTVDALKNGSLGNLVNPGNPGEILEVITSVLNHESFADPVFLQTSVQAAYGFPSFRSRLAEVLTEHN